MASRVHVQKYPSEQNLENSVCSLIVEQAVAAIKDHGFFSIAFSGGSGAKIICRGLAALNVDLTCWRIFFCDERYVELDHSDSNYGIIKNELLDKVRSHPKSVLAINMSLSLEEAAKEYERKLKELVQVGAHGGPVLDMLLLGMGPDGHTCSLFPGHPLLKETGKYVAAISDSPKPPSCRITLTFSIINSSRCAIFLATGSSKATMIKRVLEENDDEPLPAARVKLSQGDLYWFLDEKSASLLS